MKKKSLVLISFAFIFLLTLSVVSAGFFDWLNGDATRYNTAEASQLATTISKTSDTAGTGTTFSRASARTSRTAGAKPPRGEGWTLTKTATGVDCWAKTNTANRGLFGLVK